MKSLSIRLFALALATSFGCAKTTTGITVRDLGGSGGDGPANNKLDGGNGSPDLSMSGGQDLSMSGGCMMIANWPGLMPQGGYDDTNVVTFAATTDVMTAPFNALTVEDYHGNGIPYPKMVTYSNTDTYSGCDVCTLIQACDQNSCTQTYFAQGGTINVTQSDQVVAMGTFKATASNLTLVEWDFNGDAAVQGGKCIQIARATFDVSWSGATDDGGVGPSDGGMAMGDMAQNLGCTPVVNELQTSGASASDEFVEIYNPCNAAIDLTGWKLDYRSAGNNKGGADTLLFAFTANTMIKAGGYYVAAGSAFTGKHDAVYNSGGLAAGGGAVGLKNANGQIVDSVAYQTLTATNDFTEGAGPAPVTKASQSIGRDNKSTDSNDNAADWQTYANPTPDAQN